MNDINKILEFLDFAGLQTYHEFNQQEVKKLLSESNSLTNEQIESINEQIEALVQSSQDNADLIAILNGDKDADGSVAKQVNDAIAGLLDGAPETLDTLKEIADWIANDETGTATLVDKVEALEAADAELKEYVDAADSDLKDYVDKQDAKILDSIKSISKLEIAKLFPVEQADDQTAVEAIEAIEEGKAVKLTASQIVAEDVTITKSCYIDANGSVFTGIVTVPADADVIIDNATFSNPVVMA